MKHIASIFSDKELRAFSEIGIDLNDEHDYSDSEMEEIYNQVKDTMPCDYDESGRPLENAIIFESIMDKFYDNDL